MFAEFSEVHQQLAELSSDSDDEELTKSKKLQEAMKKRREDDFKSQLAFLHHEDFLNQLGQEAIPKIDNTIKARDPWTSGNRQSANGQRNSPWIPDKG